MARQRIHLTGRLELVLPDGSTVLVAPGPYRKGVAVIPVPAKTGLRPKRAGPIEPGKRGRKPRPSTVALREKLTAERKAGRLRDPPVYVRWLLDKDPDVGLAMARTVVYRELKAHR